MMKRIAVIVCFGLFFLCLQSCFVIKAPIAVATTAVKVTGKVAVSAVKVASAPINVVTGKKKRKARKAAEKAQKKAAKKGANKGKD